MTRSRAVLVGVCLGFVLGVPGGATALAGIRSVDIVDGQVKTRDLAQGAVTSRKVADNALKGRDIAESSLGTVPDAARVGGLRVRKVFLDQHESGSGDLLSLGDLRIRWSCFNPGDLHVYARVVEGSEGEFVYTTWANGAMDWVQAGTEVEIASPAISTVAIGHLQYFDPTGRVAVFDWTAKSYESCLISGVVVGD